MGWFFSNFHIKKTAELDADTFQSVLTEVLNTRVIGLLIIRMKPIYQFQSMMQTGRGFPSVRTALISIQRNRFRESAIRFLTGFPLM